MSKMRGGAPGSVRSAARTRDWMPCAAASSPLSDCSLSTPRATRTTSCRLAANRRASCSPMPPDAPVIRAVGCIYRSRLSGLAAPRATRLPWCPHGERAKAQHLCLGTPGELAGVGQFGDAVYQRPRMVSQRFRVAGRHLVGRLAVAYEAEQGLEAALGGGRAGGVFGLLPGRVEHGGEMLRPAQREVHV